MIGRFAATGILPKFNEKLVAAGIRLPTDLFDEVVEIGGNSDDRNGVSDRASGPRWEATCCSPDGSTGASGASS